ncbi:hypothetical protein VTJ04DRAFT_2530 [Mycothermus thermophilus]|uniref:uncharacterized protein n=1 Tax=Humicola insolens TaxID=85995 RepID=UPI0037442C7D
MGPAGDISSGGSIALGIIVGLISTSVQSLGLTLQRKSHILEDEKGPYDLRRPPYRRRRWQLGMAMFISANLIGSSVQISTLPLPVLSTLQASGLVFNSICASLILGEPFTKWSCWGTLLVVCGAVPIAVFGAIPSPAHKLDELLELLARRPFVIWMSLQAFFIISLAVATDLVSYLTTLMQDHRFRLARGFAYGIISGALSAHTLLLAKSAVELIVRTIADGDNQFVHWQSWILVLALVTLALTQLYYLHRGLKLVSTSVLYPLTFCVYNIMAILDGLIYFRQTDLINPLRACLITLGTVILLSGVLALSWRLSDEQHTPGVGQSSLAPGLGMVEDTDAEDMEEEVSLHSTLLAADEGETAVTQPSYQTFAKPQPPSLSPNLSTTPSFAARNPPRAASTRLLLAEERAEIWDELDDRSSIVDSDSPNFARRRRWTGGPLTPQQRASRRFLGGDPTSTSGETEPLLATSPSSRRSPLLRTKRRKSTGFPGFTARNRTATTDSAGPGRSVSGGIAGVAKGMLRWWGRNKARSASADWTGPVRRRDEPDLEAGHARRTQGQGLGIIVPGSSDTLRNKNGNGAGRRLAIRYRRTATRPLTGITSNMPHSPSTNEANWPTPLVSKKTKQANPKHLPPFIILNHRLILTQVPLPLFRPSL